MMKMENVTNSQRLNLHFKSRKSTIILWSLVITIFVLMVYWFAGQDKSKIEINEDEIDYIMLYGVDVPIEDNLLSGGINRRLDDESAKREIVEYINSLGKVKHYRQGDPIIGTPSYQIKIFLYDDSTITLEEGGIIVVRNNDGSKWYDSKESFQELIYELYVE